MVLGILPYLIEYVSFPEETPSPPSHNRSLVERTDQQKVNLWAPQLWDPRKTVGDYLCKNYYLPLYKKLTVAKEKRMQREIDYCDNFLNKTKPVDPKHFPYQQMIRERFELSYSEIPITINGFELIVTCPVLKVKSTSDMSPKKLFKVVFFGGQLTTARNTLWYYPYGAAYCELFKDQDLPPAELYLFSAYEVRTPQKKRYKFDNLATIALVTAELLKKIGKADIWIGHSIGTMLLMLTAHRIGFQNIPKHICLDRGLSSVEAMSKNFIHGMFSLALARFSGWDADPVAIIAQLAEKIQITVFSALEDQVFKNGANYLHDPRIKQLAKSKKIRVAGFDLPYVVAWNQSTLHSYRIDLVTVQYLEKEITNFFLEDQNDLAKQVVLDALRSKGSHVPKQVSSIELNNKKDNKENTSS